MDTIITLKYAQIFLPEYYQKCITVLLLYYSKVDGMLVVYYLEVNDMF